METKYVVGIDLGGTKTLAALFDSNLRMCSSKKIKTDLGSNLKQFLKKIARLESELIASAGVRQKNIVGTGLAVPGIVDVERSVVVHCPNIPFLKKAYLAGELKDRFHHIVVIENDVNAGLYGEFRLGAAKGYQHILGVFPGTGIGGALIIHGRLYRGARGGAGEIGHVLINPYGPECGCGQRGCLEAMAGRLAISSEAAILALRQSAPVLASLAGSDLSLIKSKSLKRAIERGDESVYQLVRSKAELIGLALANTVNLIAPELIIMGGGLVEAMPKIFVRAAERMIQKHAMPHIANHVKVLPAKLKDFSVVSGVAQMVREDTILKGAD